MGERCAVCGARQRPEEDHAGPRRRDRASLPGMLGAYFVLGALTLSELLAMKGLEAHHQPALAAQLALGFSAAFLVLLLAMGGLFDRPDPWPAPGPRRRLAGWAALPLLIGGGLLIGAGFEIAARWFGARMGHATEVFDPAALGWPVVLLTLAVLPALLEEWFFRHWLMGRLGEHMGLHAAVWTSAALFGLMHLANAYLPGLVVIGAGLGYLRWATGGLLAPMLAHGLYNAAVVWLETQTP